MLSPYKQNLNNIKNYFAENNLSFDKFKNNGVACWNNKQITLGYFANEKKPDGMMPDIPSKPVLIIELNRDKTIKKYIQTEHTKKYIAA